MQVAGAAAERELNAVAAAYSAKIQRSLPTAPDSRRWDVAFGPGETHGVYMDDEGVLTSYVPLDRRHVSRVLLDTPDRMNAWFRKACPGR